MDELYKLFDWQVYEFEQTQSTATSILERNLHQKHKEAHDTSSITHKLLGKDGEIETISRSTLHHGNTHATRIHAQIGFILYAKRIVDTVNAHRMCRAHL